ncbi:MAG: hypothetical protein CH6_2639 [Candidatus Kapaibacterium sp.]|nr:MAG: hypothetical protein CH6_2639 [Candidatus Kapabacteria bacterium]
MDLNQIKHNLKSGDEFLIKDALYYLFDNKTYDEEIVQQVAGFLTAKNRGIQSLAIDCLKNVPEEFKIAASRYIAPLVASDNIEHRNIASDILLNYNDLCYDSLKPYLNHPSADVRQFALDIWGNIGSKKDWEIVFSMLNDENKNVVISAIMALGNIKVESVVDDLISKFKEDDEYKPFVLNSLGKIGGETARKFIVDVINNETDSLLQLAAIDALSYFDVDQYFVEYLLAKLIQSPKRIQPYFLKTICNLGKKYCKTFQRPLELKEIAREALKEEDPEIRKAAIFALGNSYEVLDVDSLIIEVCRFEPENIEIIFQNLVHNSSTEVLTDFIEKITFQKDNGEIFASLMDFFFREWDSMDQQKRIALMTTVLSLADELPDSLLNDFCDWFAYKERDTFQTILQNALKTSNQTTRGLLEELGSRFELF